MKHEPETQWLAFLCSISNSASFPSAVLVLMFMLMVMLMLVVVCLLLNTILGLRVGLADDFRRNELLRKVQGLVLERNKPDFDSLDPAKTGANGGSDSFFNLARALDRPHTRDG